MTISCDINKDLHIGSAKKLYFACIADIWVPTLVNPFFVFVVT